MLNSVSSTTGSTQLGLRTMSSKVVFGEKNTPITRPTALIAGCDCASGPGIDVVVTIEVPPPQSAFTSASHRVLPRITPESHKNFHPVGAQHCCAPARQNRNVVRCRICPAVVGASLQRAQAEGRILPLNFAAVAPAFRSGLRILDLALVLCPNQPKPY